MTTVFVECRPILRACNFFVNLAADVKSFTLQRVDRSHVTATEGCDSLRINLPAEIGLVPDVCTGLTRFEDIVIFRTRIDSYTQVDAKGPTYNSPPLGLRAGEQVQLLCASCQEPLTEPLRFSRILPLPSSEEVNDFFCHPHVVDNFSLEPAASDLFYNFFQFRVRSDILTNVEVGTSCKCQSCSAVLGDVQRESSKLWSTSVRSSSTPNNGPDSALDKFLTSLGHFIRDVPSQMNKIVFRTTSELSSTKYVLVLILDRALSILTGSQCFENNSINLRLGKAMKILYSSYSELSDEVNDWLQSPLSSLVSLPPNMEQDLLNYLSTMSRRAGNQRWDGMAISYVDL